MRVCWNSTADSCTPRADIRRPPDDYITQWTGSLPPWQTPFYTVTLPYCPPVLVRSLREPPRFATSKGFVVLVDPTNGPCLKKLPSRRRWDYRNHHGGRPEVEILTPPRYNTRLTPPHCYTIKFSWVLQLRWPRLGSGRSHAEGDHKAFFE